MSPAFLPSFFIVIIKDCWHWRGAQGSSWVPVPSCTGPGLEESCLRAAPCGAEPGRQAITRESWESCLAELLSCGLPWGLPVSPMHTALTGGQASQPSPPTLCSLCAQVRPTLKSWLALHALGYWAPPKSIQPFRVTFSLLFLLYFVFNDLIMMNDLMKQLFWIYLLCLGSSLSTW